MYTHTRHPCNSSNPPWTSSLLSGYFPVTLEQQRPGLGLSHLDLSVAVWQHKRLERFGYVYSLTGLIPAMVTVYFPHTCSPRPSHCRIIHQYPLDAAAGCCEFSLIELASAQ